MLWMVREFQILNKLFTYLPSIFGFYQFIRNNSVSSRLNKIPNINFNKG